MFEGQVALVTGAGSGIGRASALHLARHGARVGLLGRDEDELKDAANKIESQGGEALVLLADITDEDKLKRVYETLEQRFGRLDILFANAGVNGTWAPLDELSLEDWQQAIAINLTGTFLTVKYALPLLKRQGGSIVVTSSVNGTHMFSNTGASAYASSKAAQVAFTKMIALELAKYRIRVNVICPGAIESDIEENTERKDLERTQEPVEFPEGKIPLTDGKPGKAEEVAELVGFLASSASSHITGTEIYIDGAQSPLQG
jgi:NAD(P)-dependent dehydrogenase (short-subunit alcohol dehydrogenase family)